MLTAENLTRRFGELTAADNVSFHLPEGQTLALLGTSGSGKSTLLRMLNRLLEPDSGRVLLDGTDIHHLPPEELRRRMGYVIQHVGLFPHYTVAENVAVVPRLLNWPEERIRERTDRLLDRLGLSPAVYRDKRPDQLSGGQQQRVGIARALAADPPVILMDEPFGALDNITRQDIRRDFLELEELRSKTTVIVTHDTSEAFELGDRVALMDAGRIVQVGAPRELLFAPATDFVRRFLAPQRMGLMLRILQLSDLIVHLPVTEPQDEVWSGELTLLHALRRLAETERPVALRQDDTFYRLGHREVLTAFAQLQDNVA